MQVLSKNCTKVSMMHIFLQTFKNLFNNIFNISPALLHFSHSQNI